MNKVGFLTISYIGLGTLMTALVLLNLNRFTSVDSGYYLQAATNLLAGRGYVVSENGQLTWNGTFPIGYSALIAALSGLIGIPVLEASKLVNYIVIGISGYCWVKRLSLPQAAWVSSIWGLGGFLKIAVYTWSETLFLILLAEWVWCLYQFLLQPKASRAFILFLVGMLLFLTRYIGGYVFGLTGLIAILAWLFPNYVQSQVGKFEPGFTRQNLLAISALGFGCMSGYFCLNWHLSGSFFGGERFIGTESASELTRIFGWAILNECLLVRDFGPPGSNRLAFFGLGIQFLLGIRVYWQIRGNRFSKKLPTTGTPLSWLFILTAGLYLLTLFTLRTLSPFSNPNFRLMAPFTFCILTASCLWIGNWPARWQRVVVPYWLVLLGCSWLQLLPQADPIQRISLFWKW